MWLIVNDLPLPTNLYINYPHISLHGFMLFPTSLCICHLFPLVFQVIPLLQAFPLRLWQPTQSLTSVLLLT